MIFVDDNQKLFHLQNEHISYIFRVMEDTGVLEQLYFGERIPHQEDYRFLIEREIRPSNNLVEGSQLTSLEHIKQEVPSFGTTDFRYPAIEIEYESGDRISQFQYHSYRIINEKSVEGTLPGTFGDSNQVEQLEVKLKDRYSDLYLYLTYSLYLDEAVLTRQARLENTGVRPIFIHRLMSLNLDLPNEDYDWLHLNGAWAREAQLSRESIHIGLQQVSSTRGASSHMHNPFLALCQKTTTEYQGNVYGFNLIYSGNFLAQIERDNFDILRVQLGMNPFQFNWLLKSGQEFVCPEAVMVFSNQGFNQMSQTFHRFYMNHLIRSPWKNRKRPVLINNWEATYFDFTEEKLLEIVKVSKDLGVDLFVLDDGWFGNRNSDSGSLGNWKENLDKFPSGLEAFSEKVHQEGLLFGLWFEPEMVSKDTSIYKEHPEWVIGNPAKNISHGRNQYILDFGNLDVVEEIFQQMKKILSNVQIDYLKLDMNRYISEAFSQALPSNQQGEVLHRYILGVYSLYERLVREYPEILIESCAGGGARFDAGMLYYSPQIWASDDTDAVERLSIQSGLSMVYPISSMGSHVSAVPNHQVARITSLEMRKAVAFFGTFGYELDPTRLTQSEKDEIKTQIRDYKKYQELIYQGDFYRLETYDMNRVAWMVVSKDKKEALVAHYQILAEPNPNYKRLKLSGLDSHTRYHIKEKYIDQVRSGVDLENIGLILNQNYIGREQEYWSREMPGDFHSRIFYLKAQD